MGSLVNVAVIQSVTAQGRASDPKVSAWVDASAGTGKTSVLTDRVLRLLLDGADPNRILCITFTRAAAAEMANRIIEKLGKWAVAGDTDLVEQLSKLTGARPDAEIQTRARRLFARIVDAPAGFRIQTIHAFCQSVLRRFPLEAGVAPHFDLLDDRTGGELLAEARFDLLIDAGREPHAPLGRALALLVQYMDERGFGDLIQAVVGSRRSLAASFDAHGGVGLLLPRVWRGLGLEPGETPEAILAAACQAGAFDEPALRQACATLAGGAAMDQARSIAIAAWLDAADRVAGWSEYVDQFLTGEGEPRKGTTRAHRAAMHLLDPEAERILAVQDRVCAALTARTTEAMLVVADALFRRYAARKETRALLDYDDLVDIICRLVESDAAWVLYKLDGGVDHLLLDEAQDTNPEQWRIVKALAAEFFTGAGARDVERTLFVVGDGKQSIYSFQGADPTALRRMKRHFEEQLAGHKRGLEEVDLTTSFRSTTPVLKLVDAVFADPVAKDGVHAGEDDLLHDVSRHADPGLVELWPPVVFEDSGEALEPWALPDRPRGVDDPEARLADRIAATIQGWIANREALNRKQGPVTAGDIMILVRRRTRFVEPMVRALKARNVPVAGVDRLALTEPLAVQDLMALGRFLLLPEDDLTLAVLLKSPLIGLDEEQLFTLAYDRSGSLWSALLTAAERDTAAFEPTRAWLADRLAEVDFVRPFELYAGILAAPCPGDADGSGRRALWRRLGPDALDPLEEFLSAALDYEQRHVATLQGFIGWLEASETEIKRELAGRGDAVRIVTVHGAKGLEAPIVILPDTMQTPTASTGPILLWREVEGSRIPYWSPRAEMRPGLCAGLAADANRAVQQEYRRLLYVALTRARDRLYVCGWHGKRTPAEGHWYGFIEAGMRRLGAVEIEDSDGTILRIAHTGTEMPGRAAPSPAPASVLPALPHWVRQAAPPEPRPFRPLAPSRIEMPGAAEPPVRSPVAGDDARRFRRGRAVHRLLQLLPAITPEDRVPAGTRLLADFPPEQRESLVKEALAVIADPACTHLFGPSSRAEVPIVGRIGTRGISGQIDRLLVETGRITIVDFKSGRIPPAGPRDVPAAYLGQMAAYRAILRQIYPDREIALVLVWTDGPVAVTLDAESLDPYEAYLTSTPVMLGRREVP